MPCNLHELVDHLSKRGYCFSEITPNYCCRTMALMPLNDCEVLKLWWRIWACPCYLQVYHIKVNDHLFQDSASFVSTFTNPQAYSEVPLGQPVYFSHLLLWPQGPDPCFPPAFLCFCQVGLADTGWCLEPCTWSPLHWWDLVRILVFMRGCVYWMK